MIERIVAAMGCPTQDPAVQQLLTALGPAGKPAKPSRDGYVVAKKHGVELSFDESVRNDLFPMRKLDRKQVKYLCYGWLREPYQGDWPRGYRPDLSFAEMRKCYGEGFEIWATDWDDVKEARWHVPVPSRPGVELRPTFHFARQRASLAVAAVSHFGHFEYLDAERADPYAGFFIAWCIERNLLHPELAKRSSASAKAVRERRKTGREFIVLEIDHRAWDGKHNHVWACDLSPDHREFFQCYLHDLCTEELWGKYETGYQDDFRSLFGKRFRAVKEHPPRWDAVPDTWDHYDEIAPRITQRFEAWASRSKERRGRIAG